MESSISPGQDFFLITPSDTVPLTTRIRALVIGVGGAVKFTKVDGTTVTTTLPAGIFPVTNITLVWATGTTATGFTGITI